MKTVVSLRLEGAQDIDTIYALTAAAFRGRPYAGGDEQDVVNRLRDCGALLLSLVAIYDGQVAGHIAFSPATSASNAKDEAWVALGPVSVLPEFQNLGIGAQLINAGLDRMSASGKAGCILTGNPDYYTRFGFVVSPEHCPVNEPGEFFMLKLLNASHCSGRFTFHPAFYGPVSSPE